MSFEMATGISSQADVYAAGREAAEQVMNALSGKHPHLLFVFSSIRFADPRLLRGIRSMTGDVPLVGCTDAGCINTSGPKRRSVIVVGWYAPKARFTTSVARHVSNGSLGAGEALGRSLVRDGLSGAKAVFVFPDGLSTNGTELIRGLEKSLLGRVPVTGGCAGDDLLFQKPFQYFGDEILTDAAPAVLVSGEISVGIAQRHGWMPLGRPHRVTRASGHVVYQLDKRPAVSIYEDYLGIKRQELAQEPLAALAMTYPLGVAVANQPEFLLRDAFRVGKAGSLICNGEINQGSEVRLMIGGYESALEAAQMAAYESAEQVGRSKLKGALVFCSVARQKMLGSEFHGEIDVIRNALGGAGIRIGGFYAYGELAPAIRKTRGKSENMFNNVSVVVVTVGQ